MDIKLTIMEFFGYLFYRICVFYNKAEEVTDSAFTGLAVLSLIQGINLITIMGLAFTVFHYYPDINKFWFVIPCIILYILNLIRYNKFNFWLLDDKWKNEDLAVKRKKGRGILIYIISTILLFIMALIANVMSRQ